MGRKTSKHPGAVALRILIGIVWWICGLALVILIAFAVRFLIGFTARALGW